MNTPNALKFNPDYIYLPIHKQVLKSIGWQDEQDFDITPQANVLLVKPKKQTQLTEQDELLLAEGFGMFKISKENSPTTSLFDFKVEDHITLFDESDEK